MPTTRDSGVISPAPAPASSAQLETIALVGNPNTGKTTLFNALAGMRQRVGNYPGVTVETKKGSCVCQGKEYAIIDLPGTYSLAARSPDEMVAVDVILGHQEGESRPAVVVSIVDASNLERNLYLTTQVMELGTPVVIALNMIDVAQNHGIEIDAPRLEKQLGVPVIPIQANKRKGLDQLQKAIARAVHGSAPTNLPKFPDAFERETAWLSDILDTPLERGEPGDSQVPAFRVPTFLVRRLLLDAGGYAEKRIANLVINGRRKAQNELSAAPNHEMDLKIIVQSSRQRLAEAGYAVPAVESKTRYLWIREMTAGCIQRPAQRPVTWTDRLDRILTHKVWGTLIFLGLMFVVFQAIFTWATPLMDLIKNGKDLLRGQIRDWLPPGPLTSLLVDGIMEGVGSVLVFLPQIAILFGFIAVLEDCGYMARAAFLMDKVMSRCGLSGKSFIPMLSSVACAVPGIMATRVIENRRDRLTTILVAPLMSCSARLPVYTLLIAAFLTEGYGWWVPGVTLFAMYMIGLILAPIVALLLKRTLLRGETPVFVMEMPVYKRPSVRTVVRRITDSSWAFLRRAGTLILASMIVVWAGLYFPSTDMGGRSYDLRISQLQAAMKADREDGRAEMQQEINDLYGEWKRQSWLGRTGHFIEPAVKPLGWDWRIGMAAVASFPAREVVVGTLGIIYDLGVAEPEDIRQSLGEKLRKASWDDNPDRCVFTVPTALSLMVFFALCCQCASTLMVIRRETNSWRWPIFTFAYMTVLAYFGALVVYQVGSWIS
jgi:ferrous iron transport protein B